MIPNAFVGVSAKIQANARSAEPLGLQRSGTGAVVRDGYVVTIGYLVIEAEAVEVSGADGRRLPGTVRSAIRALSPSASQRWR